MRKFSTRISVLSTLLVLSLLFSLSIFASAQTPGVSLQNGASYDADVTTRGGAVILYPTVSNFTVTGGGGVVNPVSTEAYGIRIKQQKNGQTWFARLLYVSSTQINAVLAYDTQGGETPNSLMSFTIEKPDGNGGWVAERNSFNVNVSNIAPRTYVAYSGSDPMLNADLYVCDDVNCTSASFYKKLLDGNPNPRTYNSNPTIIAIYLTGTRASVAGNSVQLNGSSAGTVLGSATEVYPGTEQVNWQLPSNISAGTHTIRVVNASSGSDGNNAKVVFQ